MGLKFLPKRLKGARKEAGYSKRGLAKVIGVDVTTIRAWEQGLRAPNNEQSLKIAEVLHHPIWHFFGFDDG